MSGPAELRFWQQVDVQKVQKEEEREQEKNRRNVATVGRRDAMTLVI